jgi:hypothetical protein
MNPLDRDREDFAELDAYMHRLNDEAVAALTGHLDISGRLHELLNIAGTAEFDPPTQMQRSGPETFDADELLDPLPSRTWLDPEPPASAADRAWMHDSPADDALLCPTGRRTGMDPEPPTSAGRLGSPENPDNPQEITDLDEGPGSPL